jgi:hypothetical protein
MSGRADEKLEVAVEIHVIPNYDAPEEIDIIRITT